MPLDLSKFDGGMIKRVNFVVLNLLAAFDATSRSEFLRTARELTEWLCSTTGQDTTIFRLNLLQIFKRERTLSDPEMQWLQTIVTTQEIHDECKMGVHILLEDFENASTCYDGLPQERKDEYKAYPIMALWKR